jgi:hypothetical protein
LMFQGAPPRFDHGVRELQVREGQDAAQHSSGDQLVDLCSAKERRGDSTSSSAFAAQSDWD